jgi:hypothetical protein
MAEETNGAFIRITNREIYDALRAVEKAVNTMDGRVNDVLGENVSLGKRVRSLELKFYTILAGLTTAVAGYALTAGRIAT